MNHWRRTMTGTSRDGKSLVRAYEMRKELEMKKEEKTNVLRVLDGKKIAYESHAYEPDATLTGEQIAGILGEDAACVFKTLVTQ